MKKIRLYRNGNAILGSDGVMHIDGRLGINRTLTEVQNRNKRYKKNFPHLIADSFYFTDKRYNEFGKMYSVDSLIY